MMRSQGAADYRDYEDPSLDPPPNQERFESLDEFLEKAFQQTRIGARQWKFWGIILCLGVANSSDASEILCLSYILSDEAFEANIVKGRTGGVLAASVFFGMLLGGLFIGTLGDWFGRKPTLLVGLSCNVCAGILSAFAPTIAILSLLRCLAGVGIGATVPPLFTLVTELAPPSQRGLCVTLCASFWMVGSIFVALVAMWLLEYAGASWRVFAIACALPSVMGVFLVHQFVPESPRFLGLEGKHFEALHAANHLAWAMSYRGSLWTIDEVERSFSRLHHRERHTNQLAGLDIMGIVRTSLSDFFISAEKLYTPQLRQTTWPLQMVWFSLSFGSYGLTTWINTIFVKVHLKDVYFNALLFAASNLPGNILAATLMDKVGRSPLLIGSVLAAATSLMGFAWCANSMNANGIVISACSFQCFITIAWNVMTTLSSELFPTTVRSAGMGVCAASGRIGAMIAQFVNGALVGKLSRLLVVASTTLAVGALTPCLLPNADITGRPVQDNFDESSHSRYAPVQQVSPNPQAKPIGPPYQDVLSIENAGVV